eukprot:11158449-Karenia_brevis.AAC.1
MSAMDQNAEEEVIPPKYDAVLDILGTHTSPEYKDLKGIPFGLAGIGMRHYKFSDGQPCHLWKGWGREASMREFLQVFREAHPQYAQHGMCLTDCRKYHDPDDDQHLR